MTKKTKPKKRTRSSKKFVINSGQVMAVYGNFAEGFQLVGPFTDFEAADAACPGAEWLWSVEPPSDPKTNWANNGIQFARLIEEAQGVGAFNNGPMLMKLCDSMDVTKDELFEIVERAQKVWDDIKGQVK